MSRSARSGVGWTLGGARAAARRGAGDGGDDGDGGAGDGEPATPHAFDVVDAERYRETAELGQGGMGRVLTALDRRLSRWVALKRVHEDGPEAGAQFAREALITAALDHPSIVPVHDAGRRPDGTLFYTMRLVRGRTLGAALRDAATLPARLALMRQFLQACEAVAYAHDQGVVHRDLKPDNILVGPFGETQVADWGLAHRDDQQDDQDEPGARRTGEARSGDTISGPGVPLGTPAYMSPEQAEGRPAQPDSDVWSLGVVLYELLAGQPPFVGSDAAAVVAAVRLGRFVPLASVQPEAPAELAAIAEKSLRLDPAERYPDARALALDLERFLDGRLVTAHRYSAREQLGRLLRAWRAPLSVAAIAAALLVAIAVVAWRRTGAERDRAVAAEQEARRALSAADRSLARSLTSQALSELSLGGRPEAEVLAAAALRLDDDPETRGVLAAFSPAGRPKLVERVATLPCRRPQLSPHGAILCVEAGEVTVHEGRPPRLRWRRAIDAQDAAWLGSAGRVAVTVNGFLGLLLDAGDGHTTAELGPLHAPHGWRTGGANQALLVNANGITIARGDLAGDGSRPSARLVSPCGPGAHIDAASDASGAMVAVACRSGEVHLLDAEGAPIRTVRALAAERSGPIALALSPDGALLVLTTFDGDAITIDIARGEPPHRQPLGLGEINEVRFAPDGSRVALRSDRGGPALWDPRARAMPLRFPAERDQSISFSADGAELLLVGAGLRRYTLPAALRAVRFQPEREVGLSQAVLSPDGGRLALALGDGRLVVVDSDSGRVRYGDRFQEGVLKGVSFHVGATGLLAWAAGRPSLRTYDPRGLPLRTLDLGPLRRAALLPSGWIVAANYSHGVLMVAPEWRTGDRAPPIAPGPRFVDAGQSADGARLALLGEDGGLWQVDDGHPPVLSPRSRHPGAHAVALSGDGTLVALALESTIEVLEVATGARRGLYPEQGLRLLDVALSHDGDRVAAGDLDGSARVWSTRDGRLLGVLHGHEGRIASVAFADGGRRLVTASWDGSARVFDLTVLQPPAAVLAAERDALWR